MLRTFGLALTAPVVVATSDDEITSPRPIRDSHTARASVDRFSARAGNQFVRTSSNGLPAAGAGLVNCPVMRIQ